MNRLLLALLALVGHASAFAPIASRSGGVTKSALNVVPPKFDKKLNKWVYTSSDQEPSAGYDKVGTLLRHGPKPYLNRVFQENDYEQAVLKFMAGDKCDRNTAQGNMDAYLKNPNDWAFARFESQNKGIKYDYVTLNQDDLVLTLVWSVIVAFFTARAAYALYAHEKFWDFPPFV